MSEKVSFDRVANPIPPKQGGGKSCWFVGCSVLLLIMLVGGLLVGWGAWKGYKHLLSYTSESQAEIPSLELSDDEWQEIDGRMKAFQKATDSGTNAVSLTLTDRDINALIARNPDFAEIRDKAFVKIEGDEISGTVSVPLDSVPGFGGRYLNGTAGLSIALEDGKMVVHITTLEVNGNSPPSEVMDQLRSKNLAEDSVKDPKARKEIERFDTLEVRDGKLMITVKPKNGNGGVPAPSELVPQAEKEKDAAPAN